MFSFESFHSPFKNRALASPDLYCHFCFFPSPIISMRKFSRPICLIRLRWDSSSKTSSSELRRRNSATSRDPASFSRVQAVVLIVLEKLVGEPVIAPMFAHLGLRQVLVDGRQFQRQSFV